MSHLADITPQSRSYTIMIVIGMKAKRFPYVPSAARDSCHRIYTGLLVEHQMHEGHDNHNQHGAHDGHEGHGVDHTGHEIMFRNRFWLSLALTIPILLFSEMFQQWFGFSLPTFPGSGWIGPAFSAIVFTVGGLSDHDRAGIYPPGEPPIDQSRLRPHDVIDLQIQRVVRLNNPQACFNSSSTQPHTNYPWCWQNNHFAATNGNVRGRFWDLTNQL
jgi:hypothetical protein